MSDEKRETVADIVAQMRGRGEDGRMDRRLWLDYADRIEAAWKRERAKVEADALEAGGIVEAGRNNGNAAAMREALVAVKKSIDDIGKSSLDCDPIILMAALTQVCARLSSRIERALSAPARNCDRFVDETDAQIAFLNEVWLISVDRETMLARDKYENWSDEMRTRYGKWLLAPAAERKGEDDDA